MVAETSAFSGRRRLKALGALLGPGDQPPQDPLVLDLLATGGGWQSVFAEADDEDLSPLLYASILRKGINLWVPEHQIDLIRHAHGRNNERNLKIRAQIKAIATALDQAGVRATLLGETASLADDVYGDLGAPVIDDISFLIDEDNLQAAVDGLSAAGYVCPESPAWQGKQCQPLVRDGEPAPARLNRWLGEQHHVLRAEEVLDATVCIEMDDVALPIPSPIHRLFQNCFQAQFEGMAFDLYRLPLSALTEQSYIIHRHGQPEPDMALEQNLRRAGLAKAFHSHRIAALWLFEGGDGSSVEATLDVHSRLCLARRSTRWVDAPLSVLAGIAGNLRWSSVGKRNGGSTTNAGVG
ncbi:MAG: nucleotidyltransferase family protein [Geminicoccaceae bacterium]